ncbi:MAG: hypothetical protein MUF27_17475 [Acidobacteria bacterium]|nr:hypothetical protein [Acidobacteriota bacterium]
MFADLESPGRPAAPPARLKDRLADPRPLVAVELRPPRRDLDGIHAMEAWIDAYHAVQRLSESDTVVFLTDNAIGSSEEENLGHLVRNLGPAARRERIVPFLTLKHPLDYCRRYADRARRERFPGLVVLGGDTHDEIPRCLPHSWQLREALRAEQPGLLLGGWVNPYRDPKEQVALLLDQGSGLDFLLTQIVSHHALGPVAAFAEEAARRGLTLPTFAGVFFYRSARPQTLAALAQFIPVPAAGLSADFLERKMSAEEVAAATLSALAGLGFTRFYLSNLETGRAPARRHAIARRAGLAAPERTAR